MHGTPSRAQQTRSLAKCSCAGPSATSAIEGNLQEKSSHLSPLPSSVTTAWLQELLQEEDDGDGSMIETLVMSAASEVAYKESKGEACIKLVRSESRSGRGLFRRTSAQLEKHGATQSRAALCEHPGRCKQHNRARLDGGTGSRGIACCAAESHVSLPNGRWHAPVSETARYVENVIDLASPEGAGDGCCAP
eukprot:CAMPEP_0119318414 /NCGR_PEP_ID=MMETSP1333-20130426/46327_1 /TAXON_ID=418940 /ORGANISM="Scyphosphaera apsteinii, Strain RCC1455" /LENGTH=191 /DNA_ID=CAMNT_0007324579 /DNA_START=86 /DNA_END=661 /DNA_ORIENTATION=+